MAFNWSIDDYGLTSQQLEEKYEKRGAHHTYDWTLCRQEIASKDASDETYWHWVKRKLQAEQAELDLSNPYN